MIHYRVMSVGVRDVEPGMSSVCFVVFLRDDSEDGIDVLVYCGETKSTLMLSVRTQKNYYPTLGRYSG